MRNKLIRFKDKIIATDNGGIGGLRGDVIFGKGRHLVPFTDPFGHTVYRSEFEEVTYKDHNIVPIGGYQFAFDKLFNIALDEETTLRVGDLNDEAPQMKIGVPRAEYKLNKYNAECSTVDAGLVVNPGVNISALNYICGFMIGDGGSKEDNITAIAPDYKNRSLYHPIPFRMSNDGYDMENGRYYGRTNSYSSIAGVSIESSYVKRFDDPKPHIVHCYVTDNPNELEIVDDTVFASTSTLAIESYVEINFSISESDCRGYFTSTDASARVNEFGLVSGWYDAEKDELSAIRLFSHFTRPSINLVEGDTIEGIYRLYAR